MHIGRITVICEWWVNKCRNAFWYNNNAVEHSEVLKSVTFLHSLSKTQVAMPSSHILLRIRTKVKYLACFLCLISNDYFSHDDCLNKERVGWLGIAEWTSVPEEWKPDKGRSLTGHKIILEKAPKINKERNRMTIIHLPPDRFLPQEPRDTKTSALYNHI